MDEPVLLLVEDSDDDAFFFKRMFQKSGLAWNLHHVTNGAAAIEFLRKSRTANSLPGVVFLDLKMPVLNGFEVLAWMQNQPFGSKIPVIVLSGSEQQEDKDRAARLGAVEYLVKPVTSTALQMLLQTLTQNAGPPPGPDVSKS